MRIEKFFITTKSDSNQQLLCENKYVAGSDMFLKRVAIIQLLRHVYFD